MRRSYAWNMLASVHFLPLLKTLAPGFLPLFVYIGAEAVFGETVGMIVGVVMGVAEFLFILIKDRKADPFVAADTILLALLGVLSICLKSPLLFRLKPAIMEGLLTILMCALLLSPDKVLKGWLDSQLKGLSTGDDAIPAMRRSVLLMTVVLAVHTVLCTWAAFALSPAAWGFVTGGLLYVMLGVALGAQLLKSRRCPTSGIAMGRNSVRSVDDAQGAFLWSLQITDGKASLYAVRPEYAGRDGNQRWDSPGRGAHETQDIRESVVRILSSLGIDPSRAAGNPGEPIQLGVAGKCVERTIFVAAISPEAFPKGVDPLYRRFWKLTDLLALRGSGRLDPDFEAEITVIAAGASGVAGPVELRPANAPDPALYRGESARL